ncbi:hypothetical protein LTR02_000658 [Friedmanniomyces endolithicus]|nr:hypothetical protein LTR94_001372 [Friedmanniomyces endolithicus]KAK0784781.1 hypothetical protein LTR38_012554 [Friedmanniomyces endolithicus]KAK0800471.1 hypothetical protein LTR59_005740 [Friedmanniomyces endolithicus]KAK0807193.1 hypothetical protein LTR75_006698 [Friedmanniomyces endolithicus]KAK0844998.1 hypothetical protein LTR03_007680 [Friedmanniomyces endolithicus]
MSSHKNKKRKPNEDSNRDRKATVDTSKPSAVFVPKEGRSHTLSIALPGSIIANAITPEQKTSLAGQIARACAVFCVDEVVVFNDGQAPTRPPEQDGYTAFADPNYFLFHVLSYLETPPHLRRALFPMHPDLKLAGSLPSLDMPHHLRSDEWCRYREAVAVRQATDDQGVPGTLLDCGISSNRVFVPVALEERTRTTVRMPEQGLKSGNTKGSLACEAVSPDTPREEGGYYWGYSVRQASSLSTVLTESPYNGGYDVSIGTSERGQPAQSLLVPGMAGYIAPTWNHLLVVFGGVAGLEAAFAADADLQRAGVPEVKELFDTWVNLVPSQGSRTIRTEEAVWIGLTTLGLALEARVRAH